MAHPDPVEGRNKRPSAPGLAHKLREEFYSDTDYLSFLEAHHEEDQHVGSSSTTISRKLLQEKIDAHLVPPEFRPSMEQERNKRMLQANTALPVGFEYVTFDWANATEVAQLASKDVDPMQIPTDKVGLVSQTLLTEWGYYDDVQKTLASGQTFSADNAASQIADFAANIAEKIPEKKIISTKVQSIVGVNLFRDPKNVYFPENRWKSTVMETYQSPASLNAHIGIFVIPKRHNVDETLYPTKFVDGETIVSRYATGADEALYRQQQLWGNWQFLPSDNYATKNSGCSVQDFNNTVCKAKGEMMASSQVGSLRFFSIRAEL